MFLKRLGFSALALAVCMIFTASLHAEIVMKIGHAQPTTTPRHKSLIKFKELVEQRTKGAIKVEIYPSAQLGDEAALIDAVKLGTIQGTRGGLFERVSPKLLIYTMPFLFEKLDAIEKVTMGPIGDKIAADAEKNGIYVLTTGDAGGFRQFSNNKHPITGPDDMKGLKLRAPGIRSIVKSLEAFGANVVSIPYGETYMALKTGVADGQENPFVNIESMKFHEVQKYVTIVNYQFHPDPFNVNPKWFKSLSPAHQKILKECAVESMKYNDKLVTEDNKKAQEIVAKSSKINVLTPAQRKLFIDRSKAVYDYFIKEGVFTQQEIDSIRKAAQGK
jgi:C4-dicarboxylate-binding protein DctP